MERGRLIILLKLLGMALSEPTEMQKSWRTDAIGIAIQYGGKYTPKPKRAEFESILSTDAILLLAKPKKV